MFLSHKLQSLSKSPQTREGRVKDFGKVMYTLLYLNWVTKKKKTFCTAHGTLLNVVTTWMRGGFGGEWIHVFVWLSPFTVHLKLSQHC